MYLKYIAMNTHNFDRRKSILPVLNLLTNIATVFLFIIYSIIKRTETSNEIVYILLVLFIINSLASVYLLYMNDVSKFKNNIRLNLWIIARIIANAGFSILTYYLIK